MGTCCAFMGELCPCRAGHRRSTKPLCSGGSARLAPLWLPPRTWFTLIKNVISVMKEALQLGSLGEIFPSCGSALWGVFPGLCISSFSS